MLHVPVGPVKSFDFAIFYDCEDEVDNDRFYDCREPPELRHPISDTGDICPLPKTEPCRHMNRRLRLAGHQSPNTIVMLSGFDVIGVDIHTLQ